MTDRIDRFLHKIESRPHSFGSLVIVTGFVGIFRAMQEYLFFGERLTAAMGLSMAIAYFHLAISLVVILHFVTGYDWRRIQNAVYLGIFLGVFPPFIDLALSGFNANIIYRFYLSESLSDVPLHFYAPAIGAPPGETAVVWLSIFFMAFYAYRKSRSVLSFLVSGILTYGYMMFHFAIVPVTTVVWARQASGGIPSQPQATLRATEIAPAFLPFWYLGLSAILYIVLRPHLRQVLLKRTLHLLPYTLLTLAGGKFMHDITPPVMLAAVSAFLMAYSVALQNDYYDAREGEHKKNVEKCDVEFFLILTGGFLLWMTQLNQMAVLPLVLIFALGILYNFPLFRMKKFFPGAQKVEGMGALMFFMTGVMVFDRAQLRPSVLVTALLLFGGWSIVVSWKDLKDFRKDTRLGYKNLYTFIMGFGKSLSQAHRISSALGLFCIAVPVVYAVLTAQYVAAAVVFVTGFMPLFVLSFFPTIKHWFKYVLLFFCIILCECMFLLKI